MITTKFVFHPVGQGCFYTGQINVGNKAPYHFVYDCGSVTTGNHLNDAIDNFKTNVLKVNNLDLMLISHFDKDHVNGVKRLLTGVRCEKIIIPYYDEVERLLLNTVLGDGDSDYREFLLNPITFFSANDFNIGEIIVVGGPDESENGENLIPKDPTIRLSTEAFNEAILSGGKISSKVSVKDGSGYGSSTAGIKVSTLGKPYIVDLTYWEFVLYLRKIETASLLEKFRQDVAKLLPPGGDMGSLFVEDAISKLKGFYKEFASDLNATSLVTYHGPTEDVTSRCVFAPETFPTNVVLLRVDKANRKFGTLLTGDIDIKSKAKGDNLRDYFYPLYFNQVSVFQVPHHGSKYCWPFYSEDYRHFKIYIINHGDKRKKHPAKEVLADIGRFLNVGSQILHQNHEFNPFYYSFSFIRMLPN